MQANRQAITKASTQANTKANKQRNKETNKQTNYIYFATFACGSPWVVSVRSIENLVLSRSLFHALLEPSAM